LFHSDNFFGSLKLKFFLVAESISNFYQSLYQFPFAETAIDTDQNDNIYLIGHSELKALSVFVFDKNMTLQQGMELAYRQPWGAFHSTKIPV